MLQIYRRMSWKIFRFVIAITGLIAISNLLEWLGHPGWGDRGYVLPTVTVLTLLGFFIYKAALYMLGQNEKSTINFFEGNIPEHWPHYWEWRKIPFEWCTKKIT